ncbi:meckelin-like [Ptychodera flava]|uniref:meckelin-like n=1 Tax=Ptychodera flava TaxID=63121 RepID=UPI003969E1F0
MALNTKQRYTFYAFVALQVFCTFADGYSFSYTEVTTCEVEQYFDLAELKCKACGDFAQTSSDGLSCDCSPGYRIDKDDGAPSEKICQACPADSMATSNGWHCIVCPAAFPLQDGRCAPCPGGNIPVEYSATGELQTEYSCASCEADTQPDEECDTCERCHQSVIDISDDCICPERLASGGLCFQSDTELLPYQEGMYSIPFESYEGDALTSWFFEENYLAAESVCRNNKNLTACQLLGNLCVYLDYNKDASYTDACKAFDALVLAADRYVNNIAGWAESMPWLTYEESAPDVLSDKGIPTVFTLSANQETSYLKFILAKYDANGEFLGYESVTGGSLQLCPDTQSNLDAAFLFATTYSQSCSIPAQDFWNMPDYENIFYDLYLEYTEGDNSFLFAVPILLENFKDGSAEPNKEIDPESWQFHRRFFMVDNLSGKTGEPSLAEVVRYASLIQLEISIQGENGKIYTPMLRIRYSEINRQDSYESNTAQSVRFEVKYTMDMTKYDRDVSIAMGTMSALAVIWAMVRTNGWRRRAGMITIDIISMFKFFFYFCGVLADVFFIVMFGCGMYWLIFFRQQSSVYLVLPGVDNETELIVYTSVAFVLKFFDLIHVIACQCIVDIFFIDWERPKGRIVQSNEPGTDSKGQVAPVSAWRMFFIANEWNEIQTTRRINIMFQLFMVILFLNVIGFEDLASSNPRAYVNTAADFYTGPDSRTLRFAVATITYLTIALCQWVFFTFIYERFVEDYLKNFVDLCSMSNVSIFLLLNRCFGYYIHGRSPHGKADTNMKEMQEQLKREEENLVGQRGLLPNNEQQTFEMLVQLKLREQYDKIMQPLAAAGAREGGQRAGAVDMERSLQAFQTMNKFLAAFLDHSLRDLDYVVKDKLLLERVLDMEFFEPTESSFFYNDDGHSFDGSLFHGHESSLLIFDLLFFCIVDLIFQDFMLATVLTYMMIAVYTRIRDAWGRNNLAKKTLVDDRFLI